MTLTEVIKGWVRDAERMSNGAARAVVVTETLFTHLVREQESNAPVVAGVGVQPLDFDAPGTADRPTFEEMVEIPGPDRVTIYVGSDPADSAYPLGLDPAMPVVFVPVPPNTVGDRAALEMYNRLRWYGLGPDEALLASNGWFRTQ